MLNRCDAPFAFWIPGFFTALKSSIRFLVSDLTVILQQIESGDSQAASRLLPLVYDELRKLAAQKMSAKLRARRFRPPRWFTRRGFASAVTNSRPGKIAPIFSPPPPRPCAAS